MSMLRRSDPVDLLRGEDGALLLYGATLVRVSALGIAVFDLVGTGIDADDLPAQLAERFGAPAEGSAAEATSAAVDALVAQGVLLRAP